MKITDQNGTERNETRTEILARHAEMVKRHAEGMALLSSIHAEEPYFKQVAEENEKENQRDAERLADEGLQTEINTSTALVNVADTLESCVTLLNKHPNGFKGFIRGTRGEIKVQPYTADEDKEAAEWEAGLSKKS